MCAESDQLKRCAAPEIHECPTVHPGSLAYSVREIEQQNSHLRYLCNEMVQTLCLERNRNHVPAELRELAAGWMKKFHEVTGANNEGEISNG